MDGHIRGNVSGFVDGEFRGIISGSVNAVVDSRQDEPPEQEYTAEDIIREEHEKDDQDQNEH